MEHKWTLNSLNERCHTCGVRRVLWEDHIAPRKCNRMAAIRSHVKAWAERLLVWCITEQCVDSGQDRAKSRQLVQREINAVFGSIEAYADYLMTETAILTERLSRRYDPGMALNEATNRVIAAKREAGEEFVSPLSGNQQAALKFQQEYLQRIARNGRA